MEITVRATLTLTFDTRDGFLSTEDEAWEEMVNYLFTGPSPDEFDISVDTDQEV